MMKEFPIGVSYSLKERKTFWVRDLKSLDISEIKNRPFIFVKPASLWKKVKPGTVGKLIDYYSAVVKPYPNTRWILQLDDIISFTPEE